MIVTISKGIQQENVRQLLSWTYPSIQEIAYIPIAVAKLMSRAAESAPFSTTVTADVVCCKTFYFLLS